MLGLQGLGWALLGSFDPVGLWDGLAAQALYGTETLPQQARPLGRLLLVLLGATDAGFFAQLYFLVRYGIGAGERWAHRGAVAGLLVWFVIDSTGSIALGAWFNVALVNVPALLIVGGPLWMLRNRAQAAAR